MIEEFMTRIPKEFFGQLHPRLIIESMESQNKIELHAIARIQEQQADLLSIRMLMSAHYDPDPYLDDAAERFLIENDERPEYLRDHAKSQRRVERMRLEAKNYRAQAFQNEKNAHPSTDQRAFNAMKKVLSSIQ